MICLELIMGFLKVGLFSFGGAYSAIPLIRDVVMSYGWLSDEELTYMIAVSESTPGPIMVNLATYVGSSQAGFWGSVLATLAVVLPSFIMILLIMGLLGKVIKSGAVQAVLRGMKPCVIGVILATGMYMTIHNCVTVGQRLQVNGRGLFVTVGLAAAMWGYGRLRKKKLSPILLIVFSAVLGVMVY